jgi:hypothetical protein
MYTNQNIKKNRFKNAGKATIVENTCLIIISARHI